jgi:hypothetical protein
MKKVKFTLLILLSTTILFSDSNKTDNSTINDNIKKAIEKEKQYKAEQKFYMGEDYNLTEHEVNPKTLDKVPTIEPEDDFDITDLYAD